MEKTIADTRCLIKHEGDLRFKILRAREDMKTSVVSGPSSVVKRKGHDVGWRMKNTDGGSQMFDGR